MSTPSTLVETVNINLEDFSETFLTCPTCLYTFDQADRKAKLLPCSHSVCLFCLQQLAALPQNADSCSLRCPLCRDVCTLPPSGVVSLPASFLINQLLDMLKGQRRDVVPSCGEHPNQQLLYCETCDLVFCDICSQSTQNKKCTVHTVIPFSIALKRMSEILIYKARGCVHALEQASANVDAELAALDRNVDGIVEQINSAFQEVSQIIENRRRELVDSVRARRDEKRKVLRDQLEMIADEQKKLERELASCQVDVRQMAKRMRAVERHAEDEQLLQPRENAYLRLNTNTSQLVCDIQKCLSEYGSVSASTTFPGASTIEQKDPAMTFTETRLLVRTFDVNGKPRTSGGDPIEAKLTTVEGADVEYGVKVEDKADGTYALVMRVPEAGDFLVSVKIFGRPIRNSPLKLSFSPHHPPIWQLGVQLKQPVKVAIDPAAAIFYVLDTGNNRIRAVKESGDVVADIQSTCLEGGSAVGLCLVPGAVPDLAVLNWRTKSVSRCNTKGDILQTMNFSEFKEPTDVAVDRRGRYLIADVDKVFVFDPTFRPLFSFPAKTGTVTCVNVGQNDDILVGTTSGLHVYDGGGRHQREIHIAPESAGPTRQMAACAAVCPDTGLVVAAVVDSKTNKAQLAVSQYKGHFGFYIDSHGARLRRPCGLNIGTGSFADRCFVVDHATNTVKGYGFK